MLSVIGISAGARPLTRTQKLNSNQPQQRGSVLVEVAISFPAFFLLVVLGIEVLRATYLASTFQNAVHRAGRYAALGLKDAGDPAGVNSVLNKISELSSLPVSDFNICPGQTPDCNTPSRGEPNEWISIRATQPISIFFGKLTLAFEARTLVQNEPNFKYVQQSLRNSDPSWPASY